MAAVTSPTFNTVCCCLSFSDVNFFVRSCTFVVALDIIGAADCKAVSPKFAIAIFALFIAVFALSNGDFVLLYVDSTVFPYCFIELDRSFKSIRFSRIAVAISAAPFFPNSSCAIFNASVSVFAFLMLPIVSFNASSIVFPSDVAFCNAFFNPASAVDAFTPFSSNCAIRLIDCGMDNPICFNAELLSSTSDSSVSTDIPVACALAVKSPSKFPV